MLLIAIHVVFVWNTAAIFIESGYAFGFWATRLKGWRYHPQRIEEAPPRNGFLLLPFRSDCFKQHWNTELVVSNIFLNVHPDPWGNDPIWRAYFVNWLKLPTRNRDHWIELTHFGWVKILEMYGNVVWFALKKSVLVGLEVLWLWPLENHLINE